MKLSRLIKDMPVVSAQLSVDPDITSVCYSSKDAAPGALFAAIRGTHADGHRYIRDALDRGASVVVVAADHSMAASPSAAMIGVEDTRKALAEIASAFYGHPSEKLNIIGVTGTNGKTTTAYLIEHLLKCAGKSVGVIGTVNYRYGARVFPNPLTTPESLEIQKILAEMAEAGITHVVMEISSHGVAQHRIHHVWFDAGVFTNLTQDHLDFHGTMETYWACKKRFFTHHLVAGPKAPAAVAVINTDNGHGRDLAAGLSGCRKILVGSSDRCDVFPLKVDLDHRGIAGELRMDGRAMLFQCGLIGHYNLENILCAAGVGLGMGISARVIRDALTSFGSVPGRLEPVPNAGDRHVFVDYAHTPDALENVLSTLRKIIPGRLICVFGCGGDRDRTKRSVMGEIAARLSDLAVVTSDNPRTEAPMDIIDDILPGVEGVRPRKYDAGDLVKGFSEPGYMVEPDREAAIFAAARMSRAGDAILIAGKGHEDYQILGATKIHFDDREKAAEALAGILGN